jgi:hypothetical protein
MRIAHILLILGVSHDNLNGSSSASTAERYYNG